MRLPDWRERLQAVIAAADGQRFVYGHTDCCQFAARCIAAVTGNDPGPEFGAYDRKGSKALLRQYGGLAGIATHVLGPAGPPNHAREGDVVLAFVDGKEVIGICEGYRCAFPSRRGVVRRGLECIRSSWKVG